MKLRVASKIKSIVDGTTDVYKVVRDFDSWNDDNKLEFINEAFYNIINHCYFKIPYYHKLFIDNGLHPKDATNIEFIKKIPVLTKEIIRANYQNLRPDDLSTIKFQNRRSGGTTGEPIRSLVSYNAAAYETFSYFKGLSWMGWEPSMKMVKIFGGSIGSSNTFNLRQKIYEKALNSILIPAFALSPNSVIEYYEALKKEPKICILGYASAIYNFVNLLRTNGIQMSNVSLVITTSEQLINDWAIVIKSYFKCPIRSYYGCGEIGSLGYQEYNSNNSYRIPVEHVYIETIGETNVLGITQLFNKAQPLIRYLNGDVGVIDGDTITRRISNLIGRTADFFIRKDGTKVSPIFGTVSIQNTLIPVQKYQYIQYLDGQIEFRYQMEKGTLTDYHKGIICQIINKVMGEDSKVAFNETTDFIISMSGKHRIAVYLNEEYS
jgi:phenylacetate-CoA ligase